MRKNVLVRAVQQWNVNGLLPLKGGVLAFVRDFRLRLDGYLTGVLYLWMSCFC